MMNNGYNSLAYNYIKAREWKEEYYYKKPNETFKRREQEDIIVELCENIVDHMAIVTVMYDKETYVRTKTSLRVSFTDKLAAFG